MVQRRSVAWLPVVGALVGGAALAGVIAWRLNLEMVEGQIKDKHAALKRLALSGKIPPNEEVMKYLTARQSALEHRYQDWVTMVAASPLTEAASADPQLYFQEQFHEVQRTLERLAAARKMTVPEQLGFPKELPPKDTVPRLLVQLSLMQEAASLMFDQGVAALVSLKIEDPEAVADVEHEGTFLTRLPVQVRLSATLPQLMKVLSALQRTNPVIDVRSVKLAASDVPDTLDAELVLARYQVMAATLETLGEPVGLGSSATTTPAPIKRSKAPGMRSAATSPRAPGGSSADRPGTESIRRASPASRSTDQGGGS